MSLNYVSKLVAIASVCFLPEFSVAEVISSEPAARDSRTLGASGTMIDEITVVASRLPVQSYASGRAVTVLDREQISELGYRYAVDLLQFVPGVSVNRAGGYGGVAQVRIRGAEANHSVVLIDGIDVSAAVTGEFDFSSLLSADIERIEVLRGPQSGVFGSNALGGVISVTTRRPQTGFESDMSIEVGDDRLREGSISVSGGSTQVLGRLNYTQRRSKFDLSEDDTLAQEKDQDDNQTLSGRLLISPGETFSLAISGRYVSKDTDTEGFDFSGGPLQGLAVDDESRSKTNDWSLGAVGTMRLAQDRSLTRLSVSQSESKLDAFFFGNQSEREQWRLDSRWQWQMASQNQATTGFIEQEKESFRNLYPFDASQRAKQTRKLVGFGVEHRLDVGEHWYINGVLRRDENDDFSDITTYALDGSYRVSANTRVHMSYGKGVTNPTFFEQFGSVPDRFEGNAALKPESSQGWDVGVEHQWQDGVWFADLTYFKADLEDEIISVFPSVANSPGTSQRQGVEFTTRFQPNVSTVLNLSYTYTDASQPGAKEVRRPKHSGAASFAYRFAADRAQFTANVTFDGKMYDQDFRNFFNNGFVSEQVALDSVMLVSLGLDFSINAAWQVHVRVENLFDERYQEVLSYRAPGRAVAAGVRLTLGGG